MIMAKKTAAQTNKYNQQQRHASEVAGNAAAASSKTANLTAESGGEDNHNQNQVVGVTPDKPTCKIKYASARIKLLKVEENSADDTAGKQ